jgi:hypothetical protein
VKRRVEPAPPKIPVHRAFSLQGLFAPPRLNEIAVSARDKCSRSSLQSGWVL